ncbi:aspartate-semialdehyde dehydrogenase [Erythrobacter sp.]|uniref:aspartate-semialdehyde dehydrogenase n=1 Tax=Erythrobacter sp. TaxID=1042 RepID=UPI002EA92D0B|nr:aspartate-semialdehyde dehydrogenase [Erythrobacter sp.]
MRTLALAALAALLAGCGGNDVPSPAERQAGAEAGAEIDEELVALHSQGLVAGAESFFFSAGQAEVTAALEDVLGEAGEASMNDECGAGPMAMVRYPGDLHVHFQDERLVGWRLGESAVNIEVDADVALGTPQAQAKAAPGFAPIKGSTLGDEFIVGDELGGFIEDGEVAMLYAGTQCFFR